MLNKLLSGLVFFSLPGLVYGPASTPPSGVPEPGIYALFAAGAVAIALVGRRKR